MNTTTHPQPPARKHDHYALAISALLEGAGKVIERLKQIADARRLPFLIELEQMHSFLESFVIMYENMPEAVVRNTLLNTVKSIVKKWHSLSAVHIAELRDIAINATSRYPEFLHEALSYIGPAVRLSPNEMKAWITVDKELSSLLTPEMILHALHQNGITIGILEKEIHDIYENNRFEEEALIAAGVHPKPGKNGYLQYCIDVDDLGKTPKLLEDGRVSFKDIKMFTYALKGECLAKAVPAVPGEPGYTVTNKPVYPVEVHEAEIPKIKHTELSPDGHSILLSEDCCVTKKYGVILLEPAVRIEGNVSFASGNIDSNVSVIVTGDVNTGFSVRSKKDILVHGIVEGAELTADGNITVKGGIQGKDQAVIEAGGDIQAKLIAYATVTAIGDIVVGNEILNSKIIADGKVSVTQSPAQITGEIGRAHV